MAKMTDDELREVLPEIAAVARAYPDDKSRLVRICMEDGLVTGMTGDGINDSPALKRADIGFAPGSASDVAKQASDIIILDDNIASITKAVMYGRTILRSIKKFLLFQLTMNLCAVGISLFAPLIGCETPVTVLQMLWINIIMDTLAGLAFAGEQAREEYMKVPPSGRTENVLTKSMICNIIYCGTVCVSLMLWYLTSDFVSSFFGGNTREFYCGFFGLFVFSGIFNCFNTRTHRLNLFSHLKENRFFMPIILLVIAVQLGLMYFGGSIFRCTPLNIYELIFVLLLSSLIIPLDLIRKLLTKRNKI
jgi:magnesium-transporting ATPase (P-type)